MVAKVFTYSYIREIVIDTRFILKICKLIKTTVACINLKMNLLTLNLWRADSFSVGLVNHARKYFTNSWLVTYENNTGISFASWVWRLHGLKYSPRWKKIKYALPVHLWRAYTVAQLPVKILSGRPWYRKSLSKKYLLVLNKIVVIYF